MQVAFERHEARRLTTPRTGIASLSRMGSAQQAGKLRRVVHETAGGAVRRSLLIWEQALPSATLPNPRSLGRFAVDHEGGQLAAINQILQVTANGAAIHPIII